MNNGSYVTPVCAGLHVKWRAHRHKFPPSVTDFSTPGTKDSRHLLQLLQVSTCLHIYSASLYFVLISVGSLIARPIQTGQSVVFSIAVFQERSSVVCVTCSRILGTLSLLSHTPHVLQHGIQCYSECTCQGYISSQFVQGFAVFTTPVDRVVCVIEMLESSYQASNLMVLGIN